MIVAGDVLHLSYEFPQNRIVLITCSEVVQDMMKHHMQVHDMLAKVACEHYVQTSGQRGTLR